MMSPTEIPLPIAPFNDVEKEMRYCWHEHTFNVYLRTHSTSRLNGTTTTQRSSRQSISAEQDGCIQVIGQATADATCSAFCRQYLGGRPGTLIPLPPCWVVPSWGRFRCPNMLPSLS